jgi:hypothetical protein
MILTIYFHQVFLKNQSDTVFVLLALEAGRDRWWWFG